MRIVFENIDPSRGGEKVFVDSDLQGRMEARAIIAAYINSSNLNPNGQKQDWGWRLAAEQAAIVDEWLRDNTMVEKVSQKYNIPAEDLQYYDFVMYLVDTAFDESANENKVSLLDKLAEAEQAYNERIKSMRDGTIFETPAVEPIGNDTTKAPDTKQTNAPTTKKK